MLKRYKIPIGAILTDNVISIPLGNLINPKLDDITDDFIDPLVQTFINPIVSGEMEAYSPRVNYELVYNFYNGSSFNSDWDWAGFDMTTDLVKNIFIKSSFLIEFYLGNQLNSNSYQFSTTLTVVPNSVTGKGSDGANSSTYTVSSGKNELYYIFYDRDISLNSNLQIDISGTSYVSLYMKPMFLNASTGEVQYFVATTQATTLSYSQFNNSLYFYEIRFFEDFTYAFYQNNVLQTRIIFNELVIV